MRTSSRSPVLWASQFSGSELPGAGAPLEARGEEACDFARCAEASWRRLAQVRIAAPLLSTPVIPLYTGVLVWLGPYPREQLRELLPLGRH